MTAVELQSDEFEKKRDISIDEFISVHHKSLTLIILGTLLIGLGILVFKKQYFVNQSKVEVIEAVDTDDKKGQEIVVEIAGSIEKPGVYKLSKSSRVEDLLIASGGISAKADREWIEKFVNRAAKLNDGQKIYIPAVGEQIDNSSANNSGGVKLHQNDVGGVSGALVNINTGSQSDLEDLPGIGPVYAQSIIEHRPYSSAEELLSKGVIKQSVFDKIKDLVTAY